MAAIIGQCVHRALSFFSDTKHLIEWKPHMNSHCTISYIVLICRVGLKGVMA